MALLGHGQLLRFEAGERYEVSMKVGEQVLLPAVRSAPAGAIIVANGFNCREPDRPGHLRRALRPAEVMRMALHA